MRSLGKEEQNHMSLVVRKSVRGFRLGPTQTELCNHRICLEA